MATALAACMLAALWALAPSAEAKTFTVTKTADPTPGPCRKHDCSLREAISAANTRPGADTVVLGSGKTYRQTLAGREEDANATGDFDVTDRLTIKRSGKRKATIDARQNDRVLHALSTKLKISGLVLKNGLETGVGGVPGGGLYVSSSDVMISSSTITQNRVLEGNGGGIEALSLVGQDPSTLRISNSAITHNRAPGLGAGIDAQTLLLRLTGSTVSDNDGLGNGASGAGLFISGEASLSRDRILRNRAGASGGGIFANSNVELTMDHMIVRGNEATNAGGGMSIGSYFPSGDFKQATIAKSTIAGNTAGGHGGGIYNSRLLKVTKSTLSDNETKVGGGAIANSSFPAGGPAQLELTNDTLAGNRADGFGGGVDNFDGADALLVNVTVTDNLADADNAGGGAGGGLHNSIQQSNVPIYNVRDSVVADNNVGTTGAAPDCYGTFISLGHNLLSNLDSCAGFTAEGDLLVANPKLGPLGSNGGPTETVPLLKGSAAVGSGGADCAKTDQRGVRRVDCDIGAFERR